VAWNIVEYRVNHLQSRLQPELLWKERYSVVSLCCQLCLRTHLAKSRAVESTDRSHLMDQERPGVVGDFPGFELVVQGLFSALTLSVG